MKKIILVCSMLTLLFYGCGATDNIPQVNRLGFTSNEPNDKYGEIIVSQIKTPVKVGQKGVLSIVGVPGKTYTAAASFDWKGKRVNTFESKIADVDGRVTWFWEVSAHTNPGNYPIAISAGKKTQIVWYTVIK